MTEVSVCQREWLNDDFLLRVANKRWKDTEAKILKYHAAPGGAPGDNYISDICRVTLETNLGTLSLIVKCLPKEEFNLKFISNSKLFEKEILIYSTILPSMRSLKPCSSLAFTPKCFSTTQDTVLALEDLSPLGFKTIDRRMGLDLEHCLAAIKCLASFHALSVGLDTQQLASNFPDTVYSGLGKAHAVSYITNGVLSVADRVKSWPGYEHFADKLHRIASSSCDRVLMHFETDRPFRVLNHGDFWTNNILFQHTDDGKVADVKIIDFQMCRYASPVFDLLYFLYTSPQEEVRLNHRQLLLAQYCNEFVSVANSLNLGTSISLEELDRAMEENAFFGFISATLMLPAVLSDPEVVPDLANVADGTSEMVWLSGDRFRHQFQNILKEFEGTSCLG